MADASGGWFRMKYTKLGRTGLDVSRLCLGCMCYGGGNSGFHQSDYRDLEGRPLNRKALEAGINFFDTANRYSVGKSEEVLGRALNDFARREEVVIATKVFNRMRPGPNGAGLSRKNILFEIDASLRRLGTDYVDLYQIHRFDHETPIEETMEALHDVVKSGKARYIGASSRHAWEFAKAQAVAERNGWTRFVSMQNLVNLMYREEEREMLPLCADQGIGVIPWSPQARGRLTRDWDYKSIRTETDEAFGRMFKSTTEEADRRVVNSVAGGGEGAGGARGPDRAGRVAAKAGHHGPHRRRNQIGASRRCAWFARGEIVGRGDRRAGGTLCPARRGRVCLTRVLRVAFAPAWIRT